MPKLWFIFQYAKIYYTSRPEKSYSRLTFFWHLITHLFQLFTLQSFVTCKNKFCQIYNIELIWGIRILVEILLVLIFAHKEKNLFELIYFCARAESLAGTVNFSTKGIYFLIFNVERMNQPNFILIQLKTW